MNTKQEYKSVEFHECIMCKAPYTKLYCIGKRLDKSQGLWPRNKRGFTTNIQKCSVCGLIFANPQPLPLDLQNHYDVSPEEYWEDDYLSIEQLLTKSERDYISVVFSEKCNLKALDIGAGLGKHMLALSKLGFESFGIEPSIAFYNKAREILGTAADKLQLASIEDAVFEESCFDFIYFGAVLEHFSNPDLALKKALTWLKPGGLIYIQVPSSKWLVAKMVNAVYKMKFDGYVANLSPMHPPYHLFEFSLTSFQKNAVINGYTVESYSYSVCKTYLPRFLDFIFKPIMKYTNTGMELYLWIRKK